MAATITDLASGASTTLNTTVVTGATVTGTVVDGDWFVVFVGVQNSGSGGAAPTITVTASGGGNTFVERAKINFDPAAAGDGATLGVYTCQVAQAITSGTITATIGNAQNTKAIQVYRMRPAAGESVTLVAVDPVGTTGNRTAHTAATVNVTSGQTIFGAACIECDEGPAGDSDTTNGNWSTIANIIADGGADANSQMCASQYKTVTATGNQSWSCTSLALFDSAATYIILTSLKALIVDAGAYAQSGQTVTLKAALIAVADPSSYALTGTDASLQHIASGSYIIGGSAGAYQNVGADASLVSGQFITAASTTYDHSGQVVTLAHSAITMVADPGSYALTGQVTTPYAGRWLTANPGSYATAGQNANLIFFTPGAYLLGAEAGSYSLSGSSAQLQPVRTMAGAGESYSLTGQDVGMVVVGTTVPRASFILAIPQQGRFGQHHT